MVDLNDELSQSVDAIPKDAISLTDAYDRLVYLISDDPRCLPEFDEDRRSQRRAGSRN